MYRNIKYENQSNDFRINYFPLALPKCNTQMYSTRCSFLLNYTSEIQFTNNILYEFTLSVLIMATRLGISLHVFIFTIKINIFHSLRIFPNRIIIFMFIQFYLKYSPRFAHCHENVSDKSLPIDSSKSKPWRNELRLKKCTT